MSFPIDISEQAGVRYLHFGSRWIQGAMRIARPWNLELDYTKEMMAPLLMRDERHFPRKVLLIGLGAASLTKFIYRNLPLAHLTVVEIEPRVVAAAKQYFKLPEDDKRIHLVLGDGAQYVLGTDKKIDLILVDGFNEHAHPGELNTLPFYRACRARLTEQGILAVNLIGLSRGVKGGFAHAEKPKTTGRPPPKKTAAKSATTEKSGPVGAKTAPRKILPHRQTTLSHGAGSRLLPGREGRIQERCARLLGCG